MRPVRINAKPHPAQLEIHNSPARFKVVAAGRRFGKSRLGVLECLDVAGRGGRAWWIAPTYQMTFVGWRPLVRLSRAIPGAVISLSERRITYPSGGEVTIRSADNPDSLRGEGLDFVIVDEAAFVKPDVWQESLRPALSDRQGRALFISTPRGRNWFWDIYRKSGADGWQSFTYPTSANPFIAPAEIEAARGDLADIIFRQEYLAEFVDMEGAVFRRVQEAVFGQPITEPADKRQYIAGVDVAASVDYTVVCVYDVMDKAMVYLDRFNRVDYGALEDRLHAVYTRWGLSTMTIEANSIGQGVIDHLAGRGMNVIPFTTTSATKQAIIQNLQSAFEHGLIKIADYPIMVGELLSFESKRNASGSFSYSAPDGMHDDCVMALAIGWEAISAPSIMVSGRY